MTRRIFLFTDLDGTIEDSRQDMAESVNRVRLQFGLKLLSITDIIPNVNRGMNELYSSCFADYLQSNADPKSTLEAVRIAYETDYLNNVTNNTKLYDGIYDALQKLSSHAQLVLITNKPEHISARLLKNLNVDSCYVKIMGGDSCPENKPSPLPLKIAAKEFNFNAKKDVAFMWGDTLADIRAGRAFGAKTIWCSWGYLALPDGETPDFVVNKPSEVEQIVLKDHNSFLGKIDKLEKYNELRKPINRRGAKRRACAPFEGRAFITDENREFKFKPVDVSESGMCVLSTELLAIGDMILFICNQVSVRLEVVSVTADEERILFRYGLKKINDKLKLDEIFLTPTKL